MNEITTLNGLTNASSLTTLQGLITANALTNASSLGTLAGLKSAASLAVVGTIDIGVWQGDTISVAYGGTGATAAANTANGVVVLDASGYCPNNSVDTGALKTTTGEITGTLDASEGAIVGSRDSAIAAYTTVLTIHNISSGDYKRSVTLPGGTYSFFPQFYYNSSVGYWQTRYVTSSGIDYWIFLLVNKFTNRIVCLYQAQDHPSYGNGGDFMTMAHPFPGYNQRLQEFNKRQHIDFTS